MRRFILFALCALFAFAAPARAEPMVGQAAPALVAPLMKGGSFDLGAAKGKVAVVYFWATWCPSCRYELPALEAVWRAQHSKGVEIVAISGDSPRAKGEVEQVMRYFTFPAAMFGSLTKNEFGTPAVVPVAYVIGKEGAVQQILYGFTDATLTDAVQQALDAKPEEKKDEVKDQAKDAPKDEKKADK